MNLPEVRQQAVEVLKTLSGNWATYALIGGLVVYVFGYLTVGTYLATLGLTNDMTALDNRYLLAGRTFLMQLVAALTSITLILLLAAAIVYWPLRLIAGAAGAGAMLSGIHTRLAVPGRLAMVGIVWSVAVIQVVMKKVFYVDGLLFLKELPEEPAWLWEFLQEQKNDALGVCFLGLVAAAVVSAGLLFLAVRSRGQDRGPRLLLGLFMFLFATQVLLLPTNYGFLLATVAQVPKLTGLNGERPVDSGEEVWLIWKDTKEYTFLVRKRSDAATTHSLRMRRLEDVTSLEVTGQEQILATLRP